MSGPGACAMWWSTAHTGAGTGALGMAGVFDSLDGTKDERWEPAGVSEPAPMSAARSKAQTQAQFSRLAPDYDAAGPGIFAHFGRRLVDVVGVELLEVPATALLATARR